MEEWHGGIIVTYLVVLVNKKFRKQNKLQKNSTSKKQIINQSATLIFFRNTMLVRPVGRGTAGTAMAVPKFWEAILKKCAGRP